MYLLIWILMMWMSFYGYATILCHVMSPFMLCNFFLVLIFSIGTGVLLATKVLPVIEPLGNVVLIYYTWFYILILFLEFATALKWREQKRELWCQLRQSIGLFPSPNCPLRASTLWSYPFKRGCHKLTYLATNVPPSML